MIQGQNLSHLFLQVINWIGFVRPTMSQNLKADSDPTLPFAEEKQNKTFMKPVLAFTDTQCVAFLTKITVTDSTESHFFKSGG